MKSLGSRDKSGLPHTVSMISTLRMSGVWTAGRHDSTVLEVRSLDWPAWQTNHRAVSFHGLLTNCQWCLNYHKSNNCLGFGYFPTFDREDASWWGGAGRAGGVVWSICFCGRSQTKPILLNTPCGATPLSSTTSGTSAPRTVLYASGAAVRWSARGVRQLSGTCSWNCTAALRCVLHSTAFGEAHQFVWFGSRYTWDVWKLLFKMFIQNIEYFCETHCRALKYFGRKVV